MSGSGGDWNEVTEDYESYWEVHQNSLTHEYRHRPRKRLTLTGVWTMGLPPEDDSYSGKARYPFMTLTTMGKEFSENALAHGFDGSENTLDRALLLIISELIEIFEDTRKGIEKSEKLPGFSVIEEELADVIIRTLETSTSRGLRIAEAVQAKHEFNKGRPFKHGKKF